VSKSDAVDPAGIPASHGFEVPDTVIGDAHALDVTPNATNAVIIVRRIIVFPPSSAVDDGEQFEDHATASQATQQDCN